MGAIYFRLRYGLLDLVDSLILGGIELKLDVAGIYIVYDVLDNLLLYFDVLFDGASYYLCLE